MERVIRMVKATKEERLHGSSQEERRSLLPLSDRATHVQPFLWCGRGGLALLLLSSFFVVLATILLIEVARHGPSMDTTRVGPHNSTLSQRGQAIQPGRNDMALFLQGAADAYHPQDNPNGYLVMLVAENRLMHAELSARLRHVLSSEQQQQQQSLSSSKNVPEWIWDYGDMTGVTLFREAVANMMERSWLRGVTVQARHLVLQAGAGSILDSLGWMLADPDDALLVTAPAYSNFRQDFQWRDRVQLYTVNTTAVNQYEPSLSDLDAVFDQAATAGHTPKILLICQPNNPVGTIYSYSAMKRMIVWALHKNMHVVSDEIYANSVFPGHHVTSAAHVRHDLAKQEKKQTNDTDHDSFYYYLGDRVHIVAGLSKDWGMSGWRVGSLFTHNDDLLQSYQNGVSYYAAVSQLTQWTITKLLSNDTWVDWYLAENRSRLETVYTALVQALSRIGVSVYPCTGGLFAWADFSAFLLAGQSEQELWLELFEDARILFTAGESFYGERPGMFRLVYTWPVGGVEAMHEMGQRLVEWKAQRDV